MGVTINNLVIQGKDNLTGREKPVKEAVSEASLAHDSHKHSKLVVNGKVKNISKKSAYLLDMLSLDDE